MGVRTRRHLLKPWEVAAQKKRDVVQMPKPASLTGHGSAHWDQVVPLICDTVEVLPCDLPALEAMCQWWHEYRTLLEADSTAPGDAYKRSISLASCFKNWTTLAAKFGLSPKDREKMAIREPIEDDPAAAYIN